MCCVLFKKLARDARWDLYTARDVKTPPSYRGTRDFGSTGGKMERQGVEIGARVSAKLTRPNAMVGTHVVGKITTIRNDSIFVTDDIYEVEMEVVPKTIEIIRRNCK